MTEDRIDGLERALVDLGRSVEFPAVPNIASAVAARLRAAPQPRPAWSELLAAFRRPAFAPVAAVVVACIFLIGSPAARVAVADWLGLDDIRITYEPPPEAVGDDLLLGSRKSLEEAEASAGFDILVPESLGAPDEVYVSEQVAGGTVSLVYEERDDLPAPFAEDVGALVTEFRATIDKAFFQKHIEGGTAIERLEVNGVVGYWIEEAHVLVYHDPIGREVAEESRLAGPALIWQKDGIVYRIESYLSKEQALSVATSLR